MKPTIHLLILVTVAVIFHSSPAPAQPIFPEAKMVNAKITASGELEIIPSKTSSKHDFDFLTGKWRMDNQRLKTRLKNSNEWESFASQDENYGPILKGIGNMDWSLLKLMSIDFFSRVINFKILLKV